MPISNPFPSYHNPRDTWEITDVWRSGLPYADKPIWKPGGIARSDAAMDTVRVETIHPIYRIRQNGVDIGWTVFWWIDLGKAPADLYGYEKDRDTPKADITAPIALTFTVATPSTSTFYRFDITSFTSSISNSCFYVGIDSIQGQSWTPDPQPSPFSPLWSEIAPVITRPIPVATFNTPIQVVLRGYVKAPSLVVSSATATVSGIFPAPTTGLNIPATSWLGTGSP